MTISDALNATAATLVDLSKILEAMAEQKETGNSNRKTKENSKKAENTVTIEDVRAVLAEKSRGGKTQEVRAILKEFGADKLSDVPSEKYTELLQKAEEL